MKKSVLVTLADRNYVNQAKQLFSSVYFNSGWTGDYLLLAHDIPEKDLKWFRKKGIIVKKVKPLITKSFGNWPSAVVDKFYLFTIYFRKWKNVVYLDGDIIVRAPIEELSKVNGFYAVYYFMILKDGFLKKDEKFNLLRKRYNLNKRTFNSGVLAFSTNIIKKDSFSELKIMLEKYVDTVTGDDPLINLYFQNMCKRLSIEYNLPNIPSKKLGLISNISKEISIIQHFMISRKPWEKDSPFNKEWEKNLEMAEKINLKNRIKIKDNSKKRGLKYYFLILNLSLYFNTQIYLMKIGRIIKNYSPRLYEVLRRLTNKYTIFKSHKMINEEST